MSLVLDERQRAMLAEMGVRVFLPEAPVTVLHHETAESPAETVAAEAMPLAREDTTARERPVSREEPVARQRPTLPSASPVVRTPLAARATGVETMDWSALQDAVGACRACKLCEGRRNTVFGVGPLRADVMVVGEAPGETEDAQGEPFVGQAGKLLDNMLRAMGRNRRESVYIANVLKCRPPGNRNPEPDEVAQCEPFLRRQVELLQPRVILAMGRFAVQSLLQTTEPVGRLRGRAHTYNGVPVVVTYHPAYLLRNLPDKAKAWADLCFAQTLLDD